METTGTSSDLRIDYVFEADLVAPFGAGFMLDNSSQGGDC